MAHFGVALSGDEQAGSDVLLTSGDEQSGTDIILLSGDEQDEDPPVVGGGGTRALIYNPIKSPISTLALQVPY